MVKGGSISGQQEEVKGEMGGRNRGKERKKRKKRGKKEERKRVRKIGIFQEKKGRNREQGLCKYEKNLGN